MPLKSIELQLRKTSISKTKHRMQNSMTHELREKTDVSGVETNKGWSTMQRYPNQFGWWEQLTRAEQIGQKGFPCYAGWAASAALWPCLEQVGASLHQPLPWTSHSRRVWGEVSWSPSWYSVLVSFFIFINASRRNRTKHIPVFGASVLKHLPEFLLT